MLDSNPQGNIWLFSGVSSGLGREWALEALQRGDRVIGITRQSTSVQDIATAYSETFFVAEEDVSDYYSLKRSVNSILIDHDLPYISHVVCSAGYAHFGTVEDTSPEDFEEIFRVNVIGSRNVAIVGVQCMPPLGDRRIIFVSSMAGLHCWPNLGPYQITKYGVRALSETLRIELAEHKIQVGCLYPGPHIGTGWAAGYAKRTPCSERYNEKWLQENSRCGFDLYEPADSLSMFQQMIDSSSMPTAGTGHEEVMRLFEDDSRMTLNELMKFGDA